MLHPIQAEAVAIVDSLNPLVINTAYRWLNDNPICSECVYTQNKEEFKEALQIYIIWKIRYKRLSGRRLVYSGSHEADLPSWGGYEKVYTAMILADNTLQKYWPCPACIVRYNPTHRTRRLSSGRRRNRRW